MTRINTHYHGFHVGKIMDIEEKKRSKIIFATHINRWVIIFQVQICKAVMPVSFWIPTFLINQNDKSVLAYNI